MPRRIVYSKPPDGAAEKIKQGRRFKRKEPKHFHVLVKFDKETYWKIREIAEKEDTSLGNTVRCMIIAHLEGKELKITIPEKPVVFLNPAMLYDKEVPPENPFI